MSTINNTPNLGVKKGPLSHVLLGETESETRGYLLVTPTHTPPQSKSSSPYLSHRTWGMGRERGVRREREL